MLPVILQQVEARLLDEGGTEARGRGPLAELLECWLERYDRSVVELASLS